TAAPAAAIVTPVSRRAAVSLPPIAGAFSGRPRQVEQLLQLVEARGAHCSALPAGDHEAHGPIEVGQLRRSQRARHLLGKAKPNDAGPVLLDLVLDGHLVSADRG